jgi:hypothetical protein
MQRPCSAAMLAIDGSPSKVFAYVESGEGFESPVIPMRLVPVSRNSIVKFTVRRVVPERLSCVLATSKRAVGESIVLDFRAFPKHKPLKALKIAILRASTSGKPQPAYCAADRVVLIY